MCMSRDIPKPVYLCIGCQGKKIIKKEKGNKKSTYNMGKVFDQHGGEENL